MRDEWKTTVFNGHNTKTQVGSHSSRGLTRAGRQQIESAAGDRIAGLTMAHRAMKLKGGSNATSAWDLNHREVSARRQVGDAAESVNPPPSSGDDGVRPWWKDVGMEEGM